MVMASYVFIVICMVALGYCLFCLYLTKNNRAVFHWIDAVHHYNRQLIYSGRWAIEEGRDGYDAVTLKPFPFPSTIRSFINDPKVVIDVYESSPNELKTKHMNRLYETAQKMIVEEQTESEL